MSKKNWLKDKQAKSLVELAKLVDQFVAIHRNNSHYSNSITQITQTLTCTTDTDLLQMHSDKSIINHKTVNSVNSSNCVNWRSQTDHNVNFKTLQNGNDANFRNSSNPNTQERNQNSRRNKNLLPSTPRCGFCHKSNHTLDQCFALQKQQERAKFGQGSNFADPVNFVQQVNNSLDKVHSSFRPFCSKATVGNADKQTKEIICFRDTGWEQTLISKELINPAEYKNAKEFRLIKGITGDVIQIPLVLVNLDCVYNNGEVLCGLIDHLPQSIDVLIGVDVDCRGVEEPFDSCVVTHVQNKSLIELEKDALVHKEEVTRNPDDFYNFEFNLEELFDEDLLKSTYCNFTV